ncbi:hypothetical protein F164LOC_18365 [Pectobacterium carotovorum]|uniref:hypothetical protein n=1 Tax=Pectobacterium versatile TaxID=2488639 RepID=UPI000C7F0204|nr:hypothetical protein [Pectobacterium versatile]PLY35858.1 hypothetical protein F164LOC_18365 [Pectobacterium carotovorum]
MSKFLWTQPLILSIALLISAISLFISSSEYKKENKELLNNKSYWASCELIEANIIIDWHSAAQNKLICGDFIENVSKTEYEFVMGHVSKDKIKSTKDE